MIFGVDLEFLTPRSRGTVYGRNEDSDNIQEYGVYVQSKTQITQKLDVLVALRGDYQSVFKEVWLSPRAALVYKPSVSNSFRVTFNRTITSPSPNSLFLDLLAARLPISADAFIPVRARGTADGYTWKRNPAYAQLGAPSDLVASSMLPGMEGADAPLGLPTATVYGLMYQGLAAIPNDVLAGMLIDALGLPDALKPLLEGRMEDIKALLHPAETNVQGFSSGQLGMLNLTTQGIDPIPNDLSPVSGIKPKRSMTIEAGYKGIMGISVLFAVDAYYSEQENFVGALQMKTPFVLVPTLSQDLTRDLATAIEANSELVTVLELMGAIAGVDVTPEYAAALLVGLAADQLPSAQTPIGIVQPNENRAPEGSIPELLVTYPNFGHVKYFGADVAVQVLASDNLSLFGNMSWVSDDFFDHTETGEDDPTAVLYMNAPSLKFKMGGAYEFDNGLSIMASGRYIKGFMMFSGQYNGEVDPYFLVDLGVGYQLDRGLRLPGSLRADLHDSNVTNNLHREL